MSVTIKGDKALTGKQVCTALGASYPDAWDSEGEFTITAAATGKAQLNYGGHFVTSQLTFNAVNLIVAGQVTATSMSVAKGNIESSINDLLKYQGEVEDKLEAFEAVGKVKTSAPEYISPEQAKPEIMEIIKTGKLVIAIKKMRELTGLNLKEAKAFVDEWKGGVSGYGPVEADEPAVIGPHTESMNLPKVKLSKAKEVGQPVQGTDSGSTYHCVAVGPSLNIAVRIRPNWKVSVRAEGVPQSIPIALQEEMSAAGWGMPGDKHMSMHMECGDKVMGRKAIGALLMSMSAPFSSMTSQVDQFVGAGQ